MVYQHNYSYVTIASLEILQISRIQDKIDYRKSRNFRVTKLSLEKFCVINIFVGTTPYHIEACAYTDFVILFFITSIDYENIFTKKISRFTVQHYIKIGLRKSMLIQHTNVYLGVLILW